MKIARVSFGLLAASAALALSLSPTTFADEDAGWYAGVNAGQSRAKIGDGRITNGLLGEGFTTTSISNDDHHFGFKAFGGYEFNRYFALEAGYFDLGRFGFTADTIPAGSLRGDIKIKGGNFDLVGSVPIGEKFSLFARAGLNYADVKDTFAGTGAVVVLNRSPHKWDPDYKFGFGAEYDFIRSLAFASRRSATGSTMPSATRVTSIFIRRESCFDSAARRRPRSRAQSSPLSRLRQSRHHRRRHRHHHRPHRQCANG